MENLEEITCYCPVQSVALMATSYLKTNFGKKPIALKKALTLLSFLFTARSGGGGFVQISSRLLAEMMGGKSSAQKIVAALEDAGWIERNHSYRVASPTKRAKCKGYRLTPKALGIEWKQEKRKYPSKPQPRHDERPQLDGVSIDYDSALIYLAGSDLSQQAKAKIQVSIERFDSKFSRGMTGRLWTSANRLKKEFRRFVTINGNRTVEIDVKCCHPLLLATLYLEETEESAKFLALVESGGFYADVLEFRRKSAKEVTLKQAKKGVTTWLGSGKHPPTYHYFKERWPEMFSLVMKIHSGGGNALSHHLQRLESAIFVEEFPSRFGRQSVSIHDGLLVEAAFEEEAAALLTEIFQEFHGLTPTLH